MEFKFKVKDEVIKSDEPYEMGEGCEWKILQMWHNSWSHTNEYLIEGGYCNQFHEVVIEDKIELLGT